MMVEDTVLVVPPPRSLVPSFGPCFTVTYHAYQLQQTYNPPSPSLQFIYASGALQLPKSQNPMGTSTPRIEP